MQQSYFVHESASIDDGLTIGQNSKIWHFCHIMSGAKHGEKCNLGQNVFVGEDEQLGNNVKVRSNVLIYTVVTCKDDVFLGPAMVFTHVINPRRAVNRHDQYLQARVKQGATIGANATIVCGNDMGRYAFIGAGTVVTKEVTECLACWQPCPPNRLDERSRPQAAF